MMTENDAAAFVGYWKITKMEVWRQKYVDLVVPGFIEFALEDECLTGSFQFWGRDRLVGLSSPHR